MPPTKKAVTPADKLAWLKANKKKFSGSRDAARAMKKHFGTALWIPAIAAVMNPGGKKKAAKKKAGQKAATLKPVRRKKSANGRRKAARRKAAPRRGSTAAPGWVVAIPGRGRGWSLTAYATKAEAEEAANAALARGVKANRLTVYQAVSTKVKKVAQVSL